MLKITKQENRYLILTPSTYTLHECIHNHTDTHSHTYTHKRILLNINSAILLFGSINKIQQEFCVQVSTEKYRDLKKYREHTEFSDPCQSQLKHL